MKRLSTCLMLLCLMSLTGCSLNFTDFSAPDGSYKVKMPGTPKRISTGGVQGDVYEIVTGRWNFAVASIQLPGIVGTLGSSQQNAALDGGVQGMARQTRATTKSSVPITLNGFPGRESEFSIPAGPDPSTGKHQPASTAIIRIYLVNSKLIMLMARSMNSITKDSADVKTFFDSFVLNASASPSGGMSSMPGGTMPGAGMHGANAGTGTVPPSTMPGGTYPPTAGGHNTSGTSPMPTSTYPPTAGGHNTAGTSPMPMPTGTYPPPAGTNPAGTYPPPTAGGHSTAGTTPMPMPTGTYPPPAGTTPMPMGTNTAGTFPGQQGNAPTFTGAPITPETKLAVGDSVQLSVNGRWVDVKVTRVSPDGPVQVRSLTRPPVFQFFPREVLQLPPGTPDPAVASNDTPRTDPSGLPKSSSAGLPKSKSTGGFSKPSDSATQTKAETSSAAGLVSLDSASVNELIRIIGKKSEHRRILAAEKLRDHSEAGPNADVGKKLIDLLKTDQVTVRNAVAQTLEKWAAPENNAAVLKSMKGATTEIRQSMMRILAANQYEPAANEIAECLADKDDRKVAMESLIAIGEPAQAAVIKMLGHRDSKTKLAACDVLKEIGSTDAVTALKKAADSWTGTDRLAAKKVLKELEAKK